MSDKIETNGISRRGLLGATATGTMLGAMGLPLSLIHI